MILKELEKIVQEEKEKGALGAYIRNALKEYLQVYVLYFIYTSKSYRKNLIFTGGTCLRHFYGLERLSEDLDFDFLPAFTTGEFAKDLRDFFSVRFKYRDLVVAVKQKGNQILLKFPVLQKLGLSQPGESDLLYVRVDVSKGLSRHPSTVTTSETKYGFNYVAIHYDLPSLMSGKLHAILKRKYVHGKKEEGIKGRDYFDLLWFVKKGVQPNLGRLSDLLGEKVTLEEVEKGVNGKVKRFVSRHKSDFERDMAPLLKNPESIRYYVENYFAEYLRNKNHSFQSLS